MFKISEFSRLSQVSVKTLRYYDELGLLKPAHTDPLRLKFKYPLRRHEWEQRERRLPDAHPGRSTVSNASCFPFFRRKYVEGPSVFPF